MLTISLQEDNSRLGLRLKNENEEDATNVVIKDQNVREHPVHG